MPWRVSGDPRIDAALQDPEVRYYIDREVRYGQTRALEVVLALIMLGVGVVLLYPSPTFSTPQWHVIASYVTENEAGSVSFAIGAIRLGALWVNGRRNYTPIPRTLGCVGGALFWATLALGFILAVPPLSIATVLFPILALGELYSANRAGADLFVVDSLGIRRRLRERDHDRRAAAG